MRHAVRRRTGVLQEWPLALVIVVAGAGLTMLGAGAVRTGGLVLAAALGLGALLRTCLPLRRTGMLAVRSRAADVVTLAGAGVLLAILVLATPPGPGSALGG